MYLATMGGMKLCTRPQPRVSRFNRRNLISTLSRRAEDHVFLSATGFSLPAPRARVQSQDLHATGMSVPSEAAASE